MPTPVRILGAGPAGLAAAINLAHAGFPVEVFEKRHDCGARFHGDLQGLENWSRPTDALDDHGSNREGSGCDHDSPSFQEFLRSVNSHGVAILPHSVRGTRVAAAIQQFARARAADLIVMGTRGFGRADAILPGTTASQTLMETEIPVLAVTHYGSQLSLAQVLRADEAVPQPSPRAG